MRPLRLKVSLLADAYVYVLDAGLRGLTPGSRQSEQFDFLDYTLLRKRNPSAETVPSLLQGGFSAPADAGP